jgi:predicted RNA-binding Zn-ribbon protein involved in translation (DUF1610 family)
MDRTLFATTEPTLSVSSRDIDEGRIGLEADVAIHVCPSCNTELEDRYHFDCPECDRSGLPVSRCRRCGGALSDELVRYTAEGANGSVSRALPGVSCRSCAVTGVEAHELEALEALAESVLGPLEVLPELGIATPEALEVLADADVCGAGEPEEIVKQRDGMRLRIGHPSALFESALGVVTEHDPGDIFSPTLSLVPGPPYSHARRRTIQRLLAEVQSELGAPVTCWSASVGLSEEPLVDSVLTAQLVAWDAEHDGMALAVYHAIIAGYAPGRFRNSVRLLEQVLGVAPGAALADRLRERVGTLSRPPLDVLQRLWLAMHPGRAFDERRVYESMQAFQASYDAPFDGERGWRLPWEEPDFEGYSAWLRRLTSALLAD